MHAATLCVVGILLVTLTNSSTAHDDISNIPSTTVEGLGVTSAPYSDDGFYISPMTQFEQGSAFTTPVTTITDEYEMTTNFGLNEFDVNSTMKEVQDILAANPALPRLSTQEILDILHNITGGPSEKISPEGHKSREYYKRALMVVLPFNANNLSDTSIQELYTKRPITRIIANKTDGSFTSTNSVPHYNSQLSKKPIRLPQVVNELTKNQSEQEQYVPEVKPTKLYSSKYRPSEEKEQLHPFGTEAQASNHRYPVTEKIEETSTLKSVQQYPSRDGLHFANYHEIDKPTTQKYLEPIQSASTHEPNTSLSVEQNKITPDIVKQQYQQQNHYHVVATTLTHTYPVEQSNNHRHNQHYLPSISTGQQYHHHQNMHATTKQTQQHQPGKRRRRPQISNHSAPFKTGINNLTTRMPLTGSTFATSSVSDHHTTSSSITSPTLQTGTNNFSTRMPSTYITAAPTRQPITQHVTKYSAVNSDNQATQKKTNGILSEPIHTSRVESPNINKYQRFETSTMRHTQAPIRFYNDGGKHQPIGQKHSQLLNNFQPITQNYKVSATTSPYRTGSQQHLDISLPNDMKDILASTGVNIPVQDNGQSQSSVLFITPSPSSQAGLQETTIIGNPPNSVSTEKNTHDKVKEVLAAIGLFPAKDMPSSTNYHAITATTAKTLTTPYASVAAESLSQEMKDILMSIGLLPSPNEERHGETIHAFTTETSLPPYNPEPTVNPSSYLSFKPLPTPRSSGENIQDDTISSDMKQFLATFGLVPMSEMGREAPSRIGTYFPYHEVPRVRSQKALVSDAEDLSLSETKHETLNKSSFTNGMPAINTEIMSNDMMDVLENLGLVPPQTKKTEEKKKIYKKGNKNIYKPSTHYAMLNHTKEETQRLNKLLDIIRHLTKENGTLTPEEIQELNTTFSIPLMSVPSSPTIQMDNRAEMDTNYETSMTLDQITNAPDPLFQVELSPTNERRNEVKRQQENSTESNTPMPSNETSSSFSSSTNATGPSLSDLADSFGGGETAPADADASKDLPTPKPNGLYFLIDWHSFLEVGEEDKGKVNLRFEPQVGNSRNFLPVNVP